MEAMSFLRKFFSHHRLSEFLLLLHKSDILIVGSFLAIPLFIHFYYVGLDKTISYADEALLLLYPSEKDYSNFFLIKEISGGQKNFLYTAQPFWFIISFLASLDIPSNIISNGIRIFVLFLPSFSMYYFLRKFQFGRVESFISAIFYTYNPHNLIPFSNPFYLIVFGSLPFLFSLFLEMLSSRSFSSIVYFSSFSSIVLWFGASNIPMASVVFLLPFFYVVFSCVFFRSCLHLPSLLQCGILLLLFNIWLFYYLLFLVDGEYASIRQAALSFVVGGSNFLDALMLKGFWAFSIPEYYHFSTTYTTPLFQLISLSIPVLVLLSFKFLTKRTIFFALLLLVGLFLVTGERQPLGNVYRTLFDHLPFFWIYRDPYSKFVPLVIFSYSVLLAQLIQQIRKHPFLSPFSWVILIFICACAFPFFTGDLVKTNPYTNNAVAVSLPRHWLDITHHFKNQYSGILFLPKNEHYGVRYLWNGSYFSGLDPARELLDSPVWLHVMGNERTPPILIDIYYAVYAGSTNFTKLLPLIGISDIVVRGDFTPNGNREPFIGFFNSFLQNVTRNSTSFGDLYLYHTNATYPFYIAHAIWRVEGERTFLPLVDESDFSQNSVVFFENEKNPLEVSKYVFIHTLNTSLSLPIVNESVYFTIPRAGTYRIKNPYNTSLCIDGKNVSDIVYLSKGTHLLNISYSGLSSPLFADASESHHKSIPLSKNISFSIHFPYDVNGIGFLVECENGSFVLQIRSSNISLSSQTVHNINTRWSDIWFPAQLRKGNYTFYFYNLGNGTCFFAIRDNPTSTVEAQDSFSSFSYKNKSLVYKPLHLLPFVALIEQSSLSQHNSSIVSFTKKNPVFYTLVVNASETSLLVFAANYHPDFVASDGVEHLPHYSCNGGFNCWLVKPGIHHIRVFFQRQKIQNILNAFSFCMMSFFLLFALFSRSKLFLYYSYL